MRPPAPAPPPPAPAPPPSHPNSGFSGAELANVVNESALLAARKDLDVVTLRELLDGLRRTKWVGSGTRNILIFLVSFRYGAWG